MIGTSPDVNTARLRWDLERRRAPGEFEKYTFGRSCIPKGLIEGRDKVWLEVGAGSGWFFTELAKRHPEAFLVAIERAKDRGKRLVRKTERSGLANVAGLRGNAIPTLINGVPTGSLERVYLLYPCPWPKMSQRRNRWYLHPVMPHLVRILKPGGLQIWASDQKFYIDEARYVLETVYGLRVLVHGPIAPNPYNGLEYFPDGRTKFERTFLSQGQPCYELIVSRPE